MVIWKNWKDFGVVKGLCTLLFPLLWHYYDVICFIMALLDNASSFWLFMVSIIKRKIINFEIHLIVDYAFFFGSIQYELCPCISY